MIERRYNNNLFLLPHNAEKEAAAVTTNGIVKRDRSLVMGAGIAQYCRDNFKGIDCALGLLVKQYGNHVYDAGTYTDAHREKAGLDARVHVLSFPTKHHFKDRSDIQLIARSCEELVRLADEKGYTAVYLPPAGCALGGLDYKTQVRPVLQEILADNRFILCLPDRIADHIGLA